MYPRQPQELFKFKSHRSKVKVIFQAKVYQIYSVEREKIVVNNVVSCLSVARSISEIFAIEIKNWPKWMTLLIALEPVLLAWWYLLRTSRPTSTTSKSLLHVKVIGQMSRSQIVCALCACHNGYCGQYLALSKAWQSSIIFVLAWIIVGLWMINIAWVFYYNYFINSRTFRLLQGEN